MNFCNCPNCQTDNCPAASELSALQKENAELRQLNSGLVEECANYRGLLYGCDDHKLWQGMACIGCMEKERDSLRTQNRELREMCKVKDKALQQTVLNCRYQANTLRGFDQGMMQGWLNLSDKCDKALALQPEK